MFARHLDQALSKHFDKYKEVLILLGARQVGKTTALHRLFPTAKYLSVEIEPIKDALEKYDPAVYAQLFSPQDRCIILDEIHLLSDPGRAAKIIYDHMPNHELIITGSSAFNIKNKASESMAGRKIDYHLYPLTLSEYLVQQNLESELSFAPFTQVITHTQTSDVIKTYNHTAILDYLLVYGLYPGQINHPSDEKYLENLVDSIIFKDLEELSLLENKKAAIGLLNLLSLQIGSLINYAELATRLGISAPTVKRYIELFEQSFIIFTLLPYSTSKRDEIGKAPKVYFYDLGLRNALIHNFNPVNKRSDKGELFENFIIAELMKYNSYGNFDYHFNYWRTTAGSEVDLVLSRPNELLAIEIKSQSRRVNRSFLTRYPGSKLSVITRDNYWV